jgi:superoxide dismutase, Cu-Zn family
MRAFSIAFSVLAALNTVAATDPKPINAIVVLSGDSKVKGTVSLVQDSADSNVVISYNLTGLEPSALRGFHVHTAGDLSKGCASAGPHYNPYGKEHGAPLDANRHVGDLGNIQSDANGNAIGKLEDSQVKLSGPNSVLGRAIVVHGGTDDLGKGTTADSKKTGNAGARPACGVIGFAA